MAWYYRIPLVSQESQTCSPAASPTLPSAASTGWRGILCRRTRGRRISAPAGAGKMTHASIFAAWARLSWPATTALRGSPGEIDPVGWSADVLCFIEVKTRTSRNVKTPEAAVDRHKRREVAAVAREYLRRQPPQPLASEVRHRERILFAVVGQPAANRSISQCLPLGVEYRFCTRERIQ
jgi:hypothetical protein